MSTEPNHAVRRRSGAGPWVALTLTCLALAIVDRSIVPAAQLALGANHREVVGADASSRLLEYPDAEPRFERLHLLRTDEVLVTSSEVAVVQSTLAWAEAGGHVPLSQTTGLYGVARRDRRNVGGFGDRERGGWFEPPPDPPRDGLVLWDAFHPGPLTFRFESAERHEGVELMRYELAAAGSEEVDDSATYEQLRLVPERYRVVTKITRAWLLVEPRTGRVIDRQQESIARFVAASDNAPLGDAHHLSWRYSPDDRARILSAVRGELRVLWLVELGVPIMLGLLALFAATMASLRWSSRQRLPRETPSP